MTGGEGGGVVDSVTDHGDVAALALEAGDGVEFLVGAEAGVDIGDGEFFAEGFCGFGAVAGEDEREEAASADGLDDVFCGEADFVAKTDAAGGVGGFDPDFGNAEGVFVG